MLRNIKENRISRKVCFDDDEFENFSSPITANCGPMWLGTSRRLYGLTTPNASPIEIHVKCLNFTGRFYFFLPSPLSSAAYHNEAWTVHFQKQLR